MPGDQITTTSFMPSGYNVTSQTVTSATDYSVTVANTTTGAATAFGTISYLSGWNQDMTAPGANARIAVTGVVPTGYNCPSGCTVVSTTPTSVTYNCLGTCPTPPVTTNGTIQEVWGGDWSGMPGLQSSAPNKSNQSIETGSQVFIQASTSDRPFVAYYEGGGSGCGMNFTYQFGTVTNPAHSCWNNSGMILGDGPSTQFNLTIGDDANLSPYLYNTSAGSLTVGTGGNDVWNFLSTGDLNPHNSGSQSIGTAGSNELANVVSDKYTMASQQVFASTLPPAPAMGTSATIHGNGTAAFVVGVGTGTTPTTETISMLGSPAGTGWVCTANDEFNAAITGHESSSNSTSVTFTWSAAPATGDHLQHVCVAY